MTEFLPTLLWRPSPNFSSRHGTRVDLLVLHDCEGGCEGSVRWFELSGSSVGALRGPRGRGEATQMVDLADNAWHACTFNRRSVGVEMGGFVSRGFDAPLLATKRACVRLFVLSFANSSRHARGRRTGYCLAPRSRPCGRRSSRSVRRPELHAEILLAWSAMSIVRAISPRCGIHTGPRRCVCCRLIQARPCRPSPYRHCRFRTFTRSADFNRRSRCSGIALP
jgi:hypothetical protein